MAKTQSKVKTRAANAVVPQNFDEANTSVAQIGRLMRRITRIEADMNDEVAAIKERFEKQADPLRLEKDELAAGLTMYCEANREELTRGGKVKYIRFPAGEVSWRIRPPKVTIRGKDAVVEKLREFRRLHKYLRVVYEINKERILDEPDGVADVKGITIGSEGEDFSIEPFETELAKEVSA